MSLRSTQRLPRALVRLGLVQLTFSAAFIIAFARVFEYGGRLVWLHLSILGAAAALTAFLLHVVLPSLPAAARRVVPGTLAALLGVLWLVYAADAVSNWFWRHNVTWELAARYLARPRVLAGYALLIADWPVLAAGILLFIAVITVLVRSRRIDAALRELQALPAAERRRTAARFGLAASLLSISAVLAAATAPGAGARRLLLQRDPLIGFFVQPERPDRLGLAALASRYRAEGPAVRAGYPDVRDFDRRNVILIVADSLRSDHLSLYGYPRRTTPFLERLHEQGGLRVVRHALATCPESNCGISSLMTSKTYGSLVKENFKLHELLRDRGYAVHFVLSGDHEWLGLRSFYGDELTTYFDGNGSRRHDLTDDRLLFEALDAIADFGGQPAFFHFHLMSTHVLGVREDRHLVFQPSRARTTWALYGGDTREMRVNNYDNGVRQADAVIEALFAALEAKGYLRDALVIITSDHGEGLGERGREGFGHAGWLYEEFLRIPLLIYEDGDASYANLEFGTQIDVAPTIVDRLGLPIPRSWEGRSLLRSGVKAYSHHFLPDPPHQAVLHRSGGLVYKLLRQAGREELFELTSDPGERRDLLASADEGLLRELRARLDGALAERVAPR